VASPARKNSPSAISNQRLNIDAPTKKTNQSPQPSKDLYIPVTPEPVQVTPCQAAPQGSPPLADQPASCDGLFQEVYRFPRAAAARTGVLITPTKKET
jgi:hypothetical protein